MTAKRRVQPEQQPPTTDDAEQSRHDRYVEKQTAGPSARTVTVACKIATGLQLQLQTPQKRIISGRDGDEVAVFNVKGGKIWHVYGPELPRGGLPEGFTPPLIVGGYALTPGIPADFWNKWVDQNKLADYFVPPDGAEHGMVFAYSTTESASAAAKEQNGLKSGLEPLSTATDKNGKLVDPRAPRPLNNNMSMLAREKAPHAEGESVSISEPA